VKQQAPAQEKGTVVVEHQAARPTNFEAEAKVEAPGKRQRQERYHAGDDRQVETMAMAAVQPWAISENYRTLLAA
jgi:hypothetical protein